MQPEDIYEKAKYLKILGSIFFYKTRSHSPIHKSKIMSKGSVNEN